MQLQRRVAVKGLRVALQLVNHPITEPVPTVASPAQELVCASAFCHNLP